MNFEKFCTACNKKTDSNSYLRHRTAGRSCYNKNRRKNKNKYLIQKEIITSNHKPKIENVNNPNISAYENHAYVVIGPRNVGKIFYILKILEKIRKKRPIH